MHGWRQAAVLILLAWATPASLATAGGGPENLLLVVNQNSDASKTIANHYIRMRDIPSVNVLYLDWQGDLNQVSSDQFREQILQPIIETINRRKLAAQIDYVVYSADFPWRVDFREEFKEEGLAKQFRPLASLTGATYLWTYSLQSNPALVMPTVNWYVPPDSRENQARCLDCSRSKTWGFRSSLLLKEDGQRTRERGEGQSYLLSTMLGVTVRRGNTESEVLRYLSRAVAADASHPDGTFYFMKNGDIRSKVRDGCYAKLAARIQDEGSKVAVRNGVVPEAADNALGIMTGTARFDLDTDRVNIAPGAICEHFTSAGGTFSNAFQTKLSEWLQAGAAGSSGTVAEPYAIQAKFPLPSLHLHYRRGASLAEAFYQSISGPYQLLIVGDPLCQPWAKPPKVEVEGIAPGDTVRGTVTVRSTVTCQPGTEPGLCELFVDGRLVARYPHALPVPLNTARLAPGEHELRIVASTSDLLEFRGRAVIPFRVAADSAEGADPQPTVRLEIEPQPMVPAGQPIAVTVTGPEDAQAIEILQNHRTVARVEGSSGRVEIGTQALGRGPVALVARVAPAESDDPPPTGSLTQSAPFWILIR